MNRLSQIGSEPLQAAFLRDEIPEVMLWLRSEGFRSVDLELLDRYLWMDAKIDAARLDSLVESGLLRREAEGRYELTDAGAEHGARVFGHHFGEMKRVTLPVACECGCCGEEPGPDETGARESARTPVLHQG